MAKLGNSTFGGFSGKLGNVVGYNRKGIWCVRTSPISIRNPRTEAQQMHRSMFAEEVRLAGHMSWALGVGMKAVADEYHMTVQNAFVSLNQQAFSMVDGAFEVDWEKITLSAGPVAPVALTEVAVDDDNVLNVKFEPNPTGANANRFDNVYIYVYSSDLAGGYLAAPVYRMDKKVKAALPDGFRARNLHVYAFVVDKFNNGSMTSYAMTKDEPIALAVQVPAFEESISSTPSLVEDKETSDSNSTIYSSSVSSEDEAASGENDGGPSGAGPTDAADDSGGNGQYEMNFF